MENNGFYVIMSQETGKPYLTENDHCKLFMSKLPAEIYCRDREGLFIEGPNFLSANELMFSCKQAGALYVDICTEKKTEEKKIGHNPKKYFNRKLNAALFHLKDTKKSVYLKKMASCMFIVPCLIENGREIMYGAAKIGDDIYSLAFSDLDEYNSWVDAETYMPLELSFPELMRASAGREIILNISGYRYVLTRKKIEKIVEQMEKEMAVDDNKGSSEKSTDTHV